MESAMVIRRLRERVYSLNGGGSKERGEEGGGGGKRGEIRRSRRIRGIRRMRREHRDEERIISVCG